MTDEHSFHLEILTPEHCFFEGDVEALTFHAGDGEWTILKSHEPMVAVMAPSTLKLKQNGVWSEAVNSEGYMEVSSHGVVLFCQTCEHPEDVDANRAEHDRQRAEEALRQSRSQSEFRNSQIMLARAMARLRITHQNVNLD